MTMSTCLQLTVPHSKAGVNYLPLSIPYNAQLQLLIFASRANFFCSYSTLYLKMNFWELLEQDLFTGRMDFLSSSNQQHQSTEEFIMQRKQTTDASEPLVDFVLGVGISKCRFVAVDFTELLNAIMRLLLTVHLNVY